MSDFLITFDKESKPEQLLDLLKSRYPLPPPEGKTFITPWGSIAVLKNNFFGYEPFSNEDGTLFIVIGRPLIIKKNNPEALTKDLPDDQQRTDCHSRKLYNLHRKLDSKNWKDILTGEFAIILVGLSQPKIEVYTDLMNSVPVYVGRDSRGEIKALGTHRDVVAHFSGCSDLTDLPSMAEFVIQGRVTFPYTFYRRLRELPPASHCTFDLSKNCLNVTECTPYWQPEAYTGPPKKVHQWAHEIGSALKKAIRDWVPEEERIGVLLSGGMDSRIVLAQTSHNTHRVAFTVCDKPNVQTEIVRKLTRKAKVKWVLLRRDKEYYGNVAGAAIRLCGGDSTWHSAHFLAFTREILSEGLKIVLGGYNADTLLKGYYCSEPLQVMGKSLPTHRARRYIGQKRVAGYIGLGIGNSVVDMINKKLIEELIERRRVYYEYMRNLRGDESASEWCQIWPCSRKEDFQNISVHRRILPKSEVFYDRRIIQLAADVPQHIKINSRVYRLAILPLLETFSEIPIFKMSLPLYCPPIIELTYSIMNRVGAKIKRQLQPPKQKLSTLETDGSWPNREWYWKNSEVLAQLRAQVLKEPPSFFEELFVTRPEEIFASSVSASAGHRILQLCLWESVRKMRLN